MKYLLSLSRYTNYLHLNPLSYIYHGGKYIEAVKF